MSFKNIAVAGDFIRAYDFKPMIGREDCYVEGQVIAANNTENGYPAFKIRVSKEVFSGKVVTDNFVGGFILVPHEVSFMEYAGRVLNLSR